MTSFFEELYWYYGGQEEIGPDKARYMDNYLVIVSLSQEIRKLECPQCDPLVRFMKKTISKTSAKVNQSFFTAGFMMLCPIN